MKNGIVNVTKDHGTTIAIWRFNLASDEAVMKDIESMKQGDFSALDMKGNTLLHTVLMHYEDGDDKIPFALISRMSVNDLLIQNKVGETALDLCKDRKDLKKVIKKKILYDKIKSIILGILFPPYGLYLLYKRYNSTTQDSYIKVNDGLPPINAEQFSATQTSKKVAFLQLLREIKAARENADDRITAQPIMTLYKIEKQCKLLYTALLSILVLFCCFERSKSCIKVYRG